VRRSSSAVSSFSDFCESEDSLDEDRSKNLLGLLEENTTLPMVFGFSLSMDILCLLMLCRDSYLLFILMLSQLVIVYDS